MSFKAWLIEIGKSARTADSYSSAVYGVISKWMIDEGLSSKALDDVHSIDKLLNISNDLKNVDIYVERNKRGNNMYSCALKTYIEYRRRDTKEELEQDVNDIIIDETINKTEKSTLISARIGQGRYRHDLIGLWEQCALTGYSDTRLLVASHIKPWRQSDNKERLDPFNGLLLLPNLDKAFDLGYITFAEDGKIIVSSYLEETDKLGIKSEMRLRLEARHLGYMDYHRDVVYERLV